jgi:hypothetical protein
MIGARAPRASSMPHTSRPMSSCFGQCARRRRAPARPRCPAPSIPCHVAFVRPVPQRTTRGPSLGWPRLGLSQSHPQKSCVRVRSRCISHLLFSLCKICLLASNRNILRLPPPAQGNKNILRPTCRNVAITPPLALATSSAAVILKH